MAELEPILNLVGQSEQGRGAEEHGSLVAEAKKSPLPLRSSAPLPPRSSAQIRRATLLRALIYIAKGEREDAIKELRKITSSGIKDSHAARAQFLVGWTLMAGQKYADASAAYERLVIDYPDSRYAVEAEKMLKRLRKLAEQRSGRDQG